LDSDQVIKEYLLGELSEDERRQFEERLIVDKVFFELVMIAEEELFDAYAESDLPEQERFITCLMATPLQRQKFRIAQAFMQYVSESEVRSVSRDSDHIREDTSGFNRWGYLRRAWAALVA
jgi:anti-sigma-K factor RskA